MPPGSTEPVDSDRGPHPDWHNVSRYEPLLLADRAAFAWEWLRRNDVYRQHWVKRHQPGADANRFGLVRFEDPDRSVPDARPIWSASLDPSVIRAKIHSFRAKASDRIDLLVWHPLLRLAIDDAQNEHLLLSDGLRSLRIDVVEGTLIGCPAELRYLIEGIASLRGPLSSIERLIRLSRTGRLDPPASRRGGVAARWIAELRVADALACDADYQQIARALYGPLIPNGQWRASHDAYRTRVQRLARVARRRLATMVDPAWFSLS